jgi:uncharacterized protein
MLTLEQLRARRNELIALADQYKAENLRVFGSVARGEAGEGSDVDFLVTFRPGASLFDLMNLRTKAETLLGEKVDVVSDGGLHHLIRERVLSEARQI